MAITKQTAGKAVKKAKSATKPPMYDDDMNDRIMGETYAKYMNDKKAGKIPLDPTIQKGIKDGTLNPDGTTKTGTQRGSESNMSRTPMKKGGMIKKKMKMGGTLKKVPAAKPGLKKLPTAVRNKMGFKKMGGAITKKK
jgi:hypothetical protein